jgi:hypothetical protein
MGDALQHLSVQPQEVVWQEVRFNTAYRARVEITNNVDAPVELQIRAGSSERYTVTPQQLTLQPRCSAQVTIQLKLLRFANKAKAIEQGQRDIFYIKVGWRPARSDGGLAGGRRRAGR